MTSNQPPPRRILEKSRTVRRRYQRSNKRLEFTPSQIQRIEREEEREKKAQQLREREKRRIANKKKKAEKEAKEREERKRLGIPDPNTFKIPASQPLLLNFFGAGNKAKEAKEDEERKECCVSPVQESKETLGQGECSDADTELGDDWFDDLIPEERAVCKENIYIHGASLPSPLNASNANSAVSHSDDRMKMPTQITNDHVAVTNRVADSFDDDTALLLQELDPGVLQKFETPQLEQVGLRLDDLNKTKNVVPLAQHDMRTSCHNNLVHQEKCLKRPGTSPLNAKTSCQFSPKETANNQETIGNGLKGAIFEVHADTEDEYDDLPLSTQDLRDLDSLIGLG